MDDRGNCIHLRLRGNYRNPAEGKRDCRIGHDANRCDSCSAFEPYQPLQFSPEVTARLERAKLEREAAARASVPGGDVESYVQTVAREAYRPWTVRLRRGVRLIRGFLRALCSWAFSKRITRKRYEMRIAACLGCEHKLAGSPVGYCGACGCGRHPLSELSIKAKMPKAECPKGKWAK